MFLSLHTMLHSYVHVTRNAGWAGVGWGGDVNVRLKLNTPLMLRWAWGGVGMWTFVWSWTRHWCDAEHGVGWGGVGMLTFVWSWTRHWCYSEHGVGWGGKNSTGLHAQWSLKLARQKKGPDFVWKGCQTQEKWPFFKDFYFETATKHWKGCHFFDNGDAPTRAIPHPAGCICVCLCVKSSKTNG